MTERVLFETSGNKVVLVRLTPKSLEHSNMDSHLLPPHHPGLRLVFGSMTFADQVDEENAIKQLEAFFSFHPADQYVEVDTAYMYAGTKTEQMLGKILTDDQKSRMRIATKGTSYIGLWHSEH